MEMHRRAIIKSITYRVVVFVITIPLTGVMVALGVHALSAVVYYIHERLWAQVKWGRYENYSNHKD